METRARASAPAKVILLGEHFVVHGGPAIVLAIDKRAIVTAKFRTDNKIWLGSRKTKGWGYFLGDEFYPVGEGEEARKKLEPIYAVARSLHYEENYGWSEN